MMNTVCLHGVYRGAKKSIEIFCDLDDLLIILAANSFLTETFQRHLLLVLGLNVSLQMNSILSQEFSLEF